jgi:hypothetical protein
VLLLDLAPAAGRAAGGAPVLDLSGVAPGRLPEGFAVARSGYGAPATWIVTTEGGSAKMQIRRMRMLWSMGLAAMFAIGSPAVSFAQLTTEQEVKAKLESEGYRDVRDVKFGPEGITLKASKDGRDWSLALDTAGKVIQQR